MTGAVCTVDGCGRGVKSRGLCNPHYLRLVRTGDPQPDVPLRPYPGAHRIGGKPRPIGHHLPSDAARAAIRLLMDSGMTVTGIAAGAGVPRGTVQRALSDDATTVTRRVYRRLLALLVEEIDAAAQPSDTSDPWCLCTDAVPLWDGGVEPDLIADRLGVTWDGLRRHLTGHGRAALAEKMLARRATRRAS